MALKWMWTTHGIISQANPTAKVHLGASALGTTSSTARIVVAVVLLRLHLAVLWHTESCRITGRNLKHNNWLLIKQALAAY
jgi:hypothetical protein